MLYVAVNIFVTFNMEYFQVMYVAVAAIYLVAAILILKADFMKKQLELMKIAEAEAIVKKEMEQEEKDNKEVENVIRACLIEFGANHEGTAWADPNLGRFSEIYNTDGNKYLVALMKMGKSLVELE